MRKTKTILILSISLNLILIVGFLFYRSYVRKTIFKVAAIYSEAEVKKLNYIISELDSNDPNKISTLKIFLRNDVKNVEQNAISCKNAATR